MQLISSIFFVLSILLLPGLLIVRTTLRFEFMLTIVLGALLTVSINIIAGVMLNALFGLNAHVWKYWLLFFDAGSLSFSFYRRPFRAGLFLKSVRDLFDGLTIQPLRFFLASSLAIAAIVLIYLSYSNLVRSEKEEAEFQYVELWILPENRPNLFEVGLRNQERIESEFTLEIFVQDRMVTRWSGVRLRPDQTFIKEWQAPDVTQFVKAEVRVFRIRDMSRAIRVVSHILRPF